MYSAAIRSPRFLIPALVLLWAAPAAAQSDPRFAADRFEPSERGSEWFANESLGFHGATIYRFGAVSSYSEHLIVIRDQNGARVGTPLRNDELLHVGGTVTLIDFVRLALDFPLQLITAGHTAGPYRSPDAAQGFGDLRFGADVRVYGKDRGPLRLALGAQFWAPIGQQQQWVSDGTWRARPRVVVAGERGSVLWSAQVGVNFRAERVGTDIALSGAAGVRVADQIVIGPEFFTSTATTDGLFRESATPFEALLGAHWLIARTIRIGGGIGHGFTKAATDPTYRVLGSIEYAPELGPPKPPEIIPPPIPPPPPVIGDSDHDGVRDDQDACPSVAGIATYDPPTNGCPPDTDGDGINDLGDACPTQPGPASTDSAMNGCPKPE